MKAQRLIWGRLSRQTSSGARGTAGQRRLPAMLRIALQAGKRNKSAKIDLRTQRKEIVK